MPRKFGLEIEFVGEISAVAAAMRRKRIPVTSTPTTHLGSHSAKWTVKRDGSVQLGGELVSPPLDFDNPAHKQQVRDAVLALQEAGAQPHHSAGIHVHIEACHEDGTRMSAREIASVVRFTYKFEDAMYRIASSGWQSIRQGVRSYAQPIPSDTAILIMEAKSFEELWGVWDGHSGRDRATGSRLLSYECDRYVATNLRSVQIRNTIEFRYFNSSVNPERIWTYIALCQAIVQDARNGFSRSVRKRYPLGSMHSGETKPDSLMMRLQQIFRSNSKDTKVCMSEEDWKNLRKICWKGSNAQPNLFRQ